MTVDRDTLLGRSGFVVWFRRYHAHGAVRRARQLPTFENVKTRRAIDHSFTTRTKVTNKIRLLPSVPGSGTFRTAFSGRAID